MESTLDQLGRTASQEIARCRAAARSRLNRDFLAALPERLFSRDLSISSLVQAIGGKRLDSVRFKTEVGETPKNLIQRLRLSAGKHLLLETDLPVWKVAISVGFSDFGAFSKAFFQEHGVRPQAFRRQQTGRSRVTLGSSDFLARAFQGSLDDSEARLLITSIAQQYPRAASRLGVEFA